MGILTVGVFSGFEAMEDGEDGLKNLVTNSVNIARYETNAQGVTFYMNDVSKTSDHGVNFRVLKK